MPLVLKSKEVARIGMERAVSLIVSIARALVISQKKATLGEKCFKQASKYRLYRVAVELRHCCVGDVGDEVDPTMLRSNFGMEH